ncbi:MAG: AMP-binding protein [Pseudomonadota bacterium]
MTDRGTIYDRFLAVAGDHPSRPFLHVPEQTAAVYELPRVDFTYAQAAAEVETLLATYRELGCGQGLRVGVALHNRPEFFFHLLALNALGCSAVPLNTAMMDTELSYLLEHSEAALVVGHASVVEQLANVAGDTLQRPPVVTPAALAGLDRRWTQASGALDEDTEAALIYTSGTTGKPKGCILSNSYFREIGRFYAGIGGYCSFRPGEDRLITPLPVSHMNALATSFMGVMETASCLIQLDRFHPRTWWESVAASGATVMHYLGVMPAMLLNAPEQDNDRSFHQVRFAFGAGCDPRHHARFEERFGIPLTEAWAMSETGAGAWITASHDPRHVGTRCFGKAPEGLDYRLVDEAGNDVPAGETGELLVRRHGEKPRQFFYSGYLKDPDATEEAWAGGWFHTGDEVRVGADGSFYFVDRRKNIIRRSGENIAAIEVESVIIRDPAVVNCVVCPVPDEIRGEEVAALLVAAPEAEPDAIAEAVFEACRQDLAYYKAPGYIGFVDAIPLTASEKVQRGEAKRLAAEAVKVGRCMDFTTRKKRPTKEAVQ